MQANYVQRLRLTFSKMGPARFIGHLDLSRTLERWFNRAQIPLAYTQGFNPRPRMALAAALPLGFTSEYELADIWLADEMEPVAAKAAMTHKMAPGISIKRVVSVPLSLPSLQASMISANYDVMMPSETNLSQLREDVERVMIAESLPLERRRGKGKVRKYDLRPLILDLKAEKREGEQVYVSMELCHSPNKSGRPDDVMYILDLDPYEVLIERTFIKLVDNAAD